MDNNDAQPVQPAGGAGLFDVDPDQGGVNQDSTVAVEGDVDALPEDMEL
jgi:hypothetical protein